MVCGVGGLLELLGGVVWMVDAVGSLLLGSAGVVLSGV